MYTGLSTVAQTDRPSDGRSGRRALPVKVPPARTGVRTRVDSVRHFGEPALLAIVPGDIAAGAARGRRVVMEAARPFLISGHADF